MKEKNKSLLMNSLISVSMCIMPFSVMAADTDHVSKLAETVQTLNEEQNVGYPDTDNTKAIYPSKDNPNFREINANTENFTFTLNDGTKNRNESASQVTYNAAVGYNIRLTEPMQAGFIIGHKEIEDAGTGSTQGKFFRYWNTSAPAPSSYGVATLSNDTDIDTDPQFSPAYPKLCYTGATSNYPTEIGNINNKNVSLIRLAENGGDSISDVKNKVKMRYLGPRELLLPVVNVEQNKLQGVDTKGISYRSNVNIKSLPCITTNGETRGDGCNLVWNDTQKCYDIQFYGDPKKSTDPNTQIGYNYMTKGNVSLVNCTNGSTAQCGINDVKSFKRDNTTGEAYRISQFVKLDIDGNTIPIEVPQQTCFNCVGVNSGAVDASCDYIVNEVYKAKGGNCAETVKALATNPRLVKNYLPSTLQNGSNCTGCLCKIEALLKAKGCS